MLKHVYEVDTQGFIAEVYLGKFEGEELVAYMNESGEFVEVDKDFVTVDHPPFYKSKWTGAGWIEGATQEEIDEITKVDPQPPTETELLKAELAKTNETLLEMMELLLGGI